MKIYIVNWFDAEPYEQGRGIEKAFYKKEDAELFVNRHEGVVLDADPDDCDYGRMISSFIEEIEVE